MDKTVPIGAQALLAFIYVGESGGNYDKLSANAEKRYPKKITSMTVQQVLDAFDTAEERKQFGMISSAAGAPQFIYKTLKRLVDTMQIDPKTKFSADLQDRMAFHLLRERGYDAYVFGRIDKVEFAKRLAQEWASLPVLSGTKNYKGQNISRGTSYYAGDGLNSANHVSADKFDAVLDKVKDLHNEAPAAPEVKPAKTVQKITTGAAVGILGTGVIADTTSTIQQVGDTIGQIKPALDNIKSVGDYGPTVLSITITALVVGLIVSYVWKWYKNR